jgi:thiol-disulfide isomerase/thioredoxin
VRVDLIKNGDYFEGRINSHPTAKALYIEFVGSASRDNNNGQGYFIPIYKDGRPVQDAYAEIARSFGSLSSTLGLKQNSQKAIDYLDLEFTIHTASIEKFPGRYIRVLQGKKKAYTPEIEEFISRLLKKENNTESLLTVIEEYYRFVDKKEKADEINQQIRSRFPKGAWLRKEKLNEFEEEKNLEKKAAIYKDALASLSPKTDEEKMAFDDDFTWEMMEALADSGYYEKLQYYDAKMFTDIERAGVYHEIAGKLIGLNVNDISTDLKTGKFYMDKAFQILNNMKDSTVPNNIRSNFLHVNALILFKQGKVTEAYEIQKKVVDGFNKSRLHHNEAFTVYVEKALGPADAKKELELFIRSGFYTRHMKDQLKRIYLSTQPQQSWDHYIASLDKEHLQKIRAELMGLRKNQSAPSFELKDLRGKTVSLADLKGKTVVLDFWATWCGPCIAAFPAMQMTIDKYKDDPNVVFLFVNTLERVSETEKIKLIDKLFDKNKYSFRVVLDERLGGGKNYKTASQYQVNAIPTKVVINPKGQVVFNETSSLINIDLIAEELTMMIELAKNVRQ